MDTVTETVLSQQSQDLFFSLKVGGDPKADLVVRSFKVDEGLSKLFTVELELASRRPDIDLTRIIDRPACLTINDRYGKPRYFHGLVETAQKGATGRPNDSGLTWTMYRLILMPAAHRLRHVSDLRIFMQQSVPQIVETVLNENGVRDFRFNLTENHPVREFLTQYRESTWDFVERLLAEEGIHFTHEFAEDKHILVMSDKSTIAADCEEAKEVEFNANPGGDVKGRWIRDFAWTEVVRTSSVTLSDYTFKNPAASLMEKYQANTNGLDSAMPVYDYPGGYKANDVGKDYARYELEALRADASSGTGKGYCQYFRAGTAFNLKEHDDKALNRKYLLVTVHHEGTQPQAMEEAAGEEGGTFYETRFSVVDAKTPWRAPRRRKPMAGNEVAIVTGPEGEEIYTDEFSRIRVKFPWDRSGRNDDTTSCWIRVAQAWGGGTYGNVAIPRIGHEVIITFLGFDPDQPLCTGRTYHANNHTPYQLPHNKTKMAIRSDTHKGSGYNELSFEDQNGEQNFFMHAEKDQTIKVKNNQIARVDANATQTIGKNQAIEVGSNVSQQVGGGMNMVIGGVGAAAAGLISQGLSGLMGQSAGLLQQGMNIAMQAMQAAGSSGSGSGAGKAAVAMASAVLGGQTGGGSPAGATPGFSPAASSSPSSMPMASSGFVATKSSGPSLADMEKQFGKERTMDIMTNGGGWGGGINEKSGPSLADMEKQFGKERTMEIMTNGGGWGGGIAEKGNQPTVEPLYAAPNEPSALGQEASTFAGLLSGGGLGALGQIAAGIDSAREGINSASAYGLATSGGSSMASAGSQLAQSVASMVGGGILNQLVSKFTNQTTGIAVNETVGHVKVITVGQAFMESVGHTKKINVGEEFTIAVGAGKDKDGNPTPPKALFVMKSDGTILLKGVKIFTASTGPTTMNGKVIDLN